MKSAAGIIPARFKSVRFPGKPLAPILGKPMLQHVYERALQAQGLQKLVIATDDQRIISAAQEFGADAVMTSPKHKSGTERVAEAAKDMDFDIILNIQGDEPLLNPEWIDKLIEALQNESTSMATLRRRGSSSEEFLDKNCVKIILNKHENALYFSRSPVPNDSHSAYWVHVGLYGFKKEFLNIFTRLSPSCLEKAECLEQLRVLENGYSIKTVEIHDSSLSVDVPQDIIKVEQKLKTQMEKND